MQNLVARWSFQRWLAFALGALNVLVAVMAGIALLGLNYIHNAAEQMKANSLKSSLASDVAMHTLLCRRYEKDFFLNAGDVAAQDAPLQQWHAASIALRGAIKAYEQNVPGAEEQQRAAAWRQAWSQYVRDFSTIEIAINTGEVTSPQEALQTFEPFHPNIQQLTDDAVQIAQGTTSSVVQNSATLDSIIGSTMRYVLIIAVIIFVAALAWTLFFPKWLLRPLVALRQGVLRIIEGDYQTQVVLDRHDEIGQLAKSYNQMAAMIQQRTTELNRQYTQAEQARTAAEEARNEIAGQLAVIEEQRTVIREMSVPILPLTNTTLVVPLIGELDSNRLNEIHSRVLQAVEQQRVRYLLLDITGVPLIDTQVSLGLIHLVQAGRLLGCQVILVGFRPEVAQSVVSLGIELRNVITHSSLQNGLQYTLGQSATV